MAAQAQWKWILRWKGLETEVGSGQGDAPEQGDFERALRAAAPHLASNQGPADDIGLELDWVSTGGEKRAPLWWRVWKYGAWEGDPPVVVYEFMPAPWRGGTTDPGNLDPGPASVNLF